MGLTETEAPTFLLVLENQINTDSVCHSVTSNYWYVTKCVDMNVTKYGMSINIFQELATF